MLVSWVLQIIKPEAKITTTKLSYFMYTLVNITATYRFTITDMELPPSDLGDVIITDRFITDYEGDKTTVKIGSPPP